MGMRERTFRTTNPCYKIRVFRIVFCALRHLGPVILVIASVSVGIAADLVITREGGAGGEMRWQALRYDIVTDSMNAFHQGGDGWADARDTRAPALGDLDNDGDAELALGREGGAGGNMRWAVYRFVDDGGDGALQQIQEGGVGWGNQRDTTALAMGDLDNDGDAELAVGRNGGAGGNMRWAVYRFVDDGGDSTLQQFDEGGGGWGNQRNTTAIAMGDLDNDGDAELALGREGGAGGNMRWAVFRYQDDGGDGVMQQFHEGGVAWGSLRDTSALAMGNLDGDGAAELVLGRDGGAGGNMRWAVYRYQDDAGDGSLQLFHEGGVQWGDLRGVTALAIGDIGGQDIDGDGLPDSWETVGLNLDGLPGAEVNLSAMGANPMHKDIFVELD